MSIVKTGEKQAIGDCKSSSPFVVADFNKDAFDVEWQEDMMWFIRVQGVAASTSVLNRETAINTPTSFEIVLFITR